MLKILFRRERQRCRSWRHSPSADSRPNADFNLRDSGLHSVFYIPDILKIDDFSLKVILHSVFYNLEIPSNDGLSSIVIPPCIK